MMQRKLIPLTRTTMFNSLQKRTIDTIFKSSTTILPTPILLPSPNTFHTLPSTPQIPNSNKHRFFSSSSSNIKRAYPKYTIYNPNCSLSFLPILPTFTLSQAGNLSLDTPGKFMIQFIPSSSSSPYGNKTYNWKDQITLALTVEEVGLLIAKFPNEGMIEFSRQTAEDGVDKVLTIMPTEEEEEEESVEFVVDFTQNGIGGQRPVSNGREDMVGPFQVTVTLGEIEVIKSILKTSLPHLIGWEKMMNISTEASITQTFGNKSDKYEFVGSKQQQQQQRTKSGFFSGGSSKGEFDF
mmetsp:Transcript_6880/g.10197  ORF Transcript_6880/g.10197 Transcript_6880/m.10197 type:complete len:295 (-) Transcript_6880:342-1226(-)